MTPLRVLAATLLILVTSATRGPVRAAEDVTRAKLDNGLRVVIIRDRLAPVATVYDNYLVGGNETPEGFPGMAHAQEHMAFRGCTGVTADQTSAIFAQLGGYGNADTQQNITQYFETVPASDLDIALRMDASCMQGIDDADSEWAEEKGAIEQEVQRDLSEPTYKFLTRLNEDMFAGTPYAHDALGTRPSFEATTGAALKKFRDAWYAPNNAILVVAGDVDPVATLAKIRQFYGSIPSKTLDAKPVITLQPVKSETFNLDSNLPYILVAEAYRLPGTDSPDYAAAQVLGDVLASQRGDLYDLVVEGKALGTEFSLGETYPKASVAFMAAAVGTGSDPNAILTSMRGVIAGYLQKGLPAELVDAAKRSEVASAEFRRNSIPDLAGQWSEALAAEGHDSPDVDVNAIARVTVDDVNRVARQTLLDANAITATLVPSPSAEPMSGKGFGGGERTTSAPTKPVVLPAWAATELATLKPPTMDTAWSDVTLPNRLRLIVKTEQASPTVTVLGEVRHEADLEAAPGKDGVADVLEQLLSYGTTTLDRLAFQKALDDIAAQESAGYAFSLRVLKADFPKGLALLADNVLRPALPADAFPIVQKQAADFEAGNLKSPGYRTDRALSTGLLPSADPALRETTPQTVSSLTLDDVKAFHAKTFRPDLTTIVVIGDITPAEARQAVEKSFGSWTASGTKPDVTLPRVPLNAASTVDVPDPTSVQSEAELAEEVGLTRTDPDYYAIQLGNHVLGGGFYATRLYHDLRQVAGLVYTVDNSFTADKTRSVYSVTYGCDPENVGKARDLVIRDLRSMQTDDVTPQELQQAKALLLRQIPLRESSEDAVAGGLLGRADLDLPLDEPVKAAQRYIALTAAEVKAAFAKWIRPDAFVQVVRGPSGK